MKRLPLTRIGVLVLAMGSLTCAALPETDKPPRPLFDDETPLELTLTGPFERIDDDRDKTQEYTGTLEHADTVLDVKYTVRGNFRLRRKVCGHVPLWIDLKKRQVDGTLFDGQNKLKLVVQCRDSKQYQEFVALEDQVYRMFRLLSPVSLRTRMAWITYEDPESGESRRQLGFLVQHHKKLAKRLDLEVVEDKTVRKSTLDAEQSSLVALFNFVIANTDYSMLGSPGDNACCHNTKGLRSETGTVYPLPYDFDQTGYISPPYAQVSQGLDQRNIRDRVYRGFCVDEAIFLANVGKIISQREALLAIAGETDYVGSRKAKRASRLLEQGLDILADEKKRNREVSRKCR